MKYNNSEPYEGCKVDKDLNKNIIILGPAKSGKSTLATNLAKNFGYNIIRVEDLAIGFRYAFPELRIDHDVDEEEVTKNFAPFLNAYMKVLSFGPNAMLKTNYIIEGVYLSADEIMKKFPKDFFIIIGLYYKEKNVDEIYKRIRKHAVAPYDWTANESDEELMPKLKQFYRKNEKFKEDYKKYNIKSFAIEENIEELTKDVAKYIESENKK